MIKKRGQWGYAPCLLINSSARNAATAPAPTIAATKVTGNALVPEVLTGVSTCTKSTLREVPA